MHKKVVMLAAALLSPLAAPAADDADIRALREELSQLRAAYEQRIDALERRLAQAEAGTAAIAPAAPSAPPAMPAGGNAFNPDISLILTGNYTSLSVDPQARPYRIGGFVPTGGEVAPPPRSFNLGESELTVSANVDHRFRGALSFAMAPDDRVSVEEAYLQTLELGSGFTAKAGRYLSGVGYMNEQHAHAWDFADTPLAYAAFLGGRMAAEGVQLKWLAPTETFLELGAEGGRGGGFPSTDRNKNGSTLGALFAHVGGDVGPSSSWRAGLSFVGTSPRGRSYEDVDAAGAATRNAFSGTSELWIADAVWKWAPQGNARQRNLTVQGEYFRRRENGVLATDARNCLRAPCEGAFSTAQSGWYAQAAWQFMPEWRIGIRHDRLDYGRVSNALAVGPGSGLSVDDFPTLAAHGPRRNTAMLEWSASEYSRVRFQYARDKSRPDAADSQLRLQYIVSLGAHGAHKF